jgi:hypothetical protein
MTKSALSSLDAYANEHLCVTHKGFRIKKLIGLQIQQHRTSVVERDLVDPKHIQIPQAVIHSMDWDFKLV